MCEELRKMLRDVFAARAAGTNYARMARAHGYVDGYMRGLLEQGLATKEELLELVAQERARIAGPATRELHYADVSEAAA
jgi:alkylhydroperoxidase/carboxymuconolactone decarboxylase family protein YurZ